MIKIGQSNNLYVKSYTKDNFPYMEVFFDSSKKTQKGKLKLKRISKHPTDKNKKLLHLSQEVRVIYSEHSRFHRDISPEEDVFPDKSLRRVSSTVFTKIYSVVEEIPATITNEMIQDKILSNKRACLYTILSNSPIKTPGLKELRPLTDVEISSQLLKYYEDEEPHKKGDLFLDKYGKPQYRITLLSLTGQPDIDLRSSDTKDYFLPESLKVKSYGGSI